MLSTIAPMASRVRPRNASPPTCHALRHFLHRQRLAEHIQSSAMNVPMRKVRKKTSSRGNPGGLAGKRSADSRALALLPTIQKLMTTGASALGLANELNRRGITGSLGGRWHRSSIRRLLTRLRQLTSKHGANNNLALKRAADVQAEDYRPTICRLRKAGFVSAKAIARELNKQGIPTPRGSKWHPTTVSRLLERLDRLDRISRS